VKFRIRPKAVHSPASTTARKDDEIASHQLHDSMIVLIRNIDDPGSAHPDA
jgi:hypothetical protein